MVVLLPILLLAAAEDLRRQRIPNLISLGGTLLGLVLWAHYGGISGLAAGLLGWMVGTAVLLPIYLLRGMGAGDVKLVGMVGTFLGAAHGFNAALTILVVGGVIAAASALRQGRLRQSIRDAYLMLILRSPGKRLGDATTKSQDVIPYGVAIALGAVGYMALVSFR